MTGNALKSRYLMIFDNERHQTERGRRATAGESNLLTRIAIFKGIQGVSLFSVTNLFLLGAKHRTHMLGAADARQASNYFAERCLVQQTNTPRENSGECCPGKREMPVSKIQRKSEKKMVMSSRLSSLSPFIKRVCIEE